jgi:two-component system nitrate/nitrite response regulator NarL
MADPIRVVVADDHPLYREGVARILSDDGLTVLAQAADAKAAAEAAERLRPDVILLDLSMPEGGGMAALRRIMLMSAPPRVCILTVSENDDDVLQALKGGALGYALKGVGARDLVHIVRELAAGRSYVSPALAGRILNAMRDGGRKPGNPLDDLSKREEDILRLVSEGLSNKEVGLKLDLQEKTVKHYMTAILQKLHVRNRTEAALMARDHWKQ